MDAMGFVLLLTGLGLGFLLGVLWARARVATTVATLTAQRQAALEQVETTKRLNTELAAARQQDRQQLTETFQALAGEALDRSGDRLLSLADHQLGTASKPIIATLDRLDTRLREIEQARGRAAAVLEQQIATVRSSGEALREQTAALVTALRKPQVRGQWGEMQLRRVVELAGMVEHCDFDTQTTFSDGDGAQRPDLIVHLAGDKHVVVDAKVPLAAFLEAAEAKDEATRLDRSRAHARQLRAHVDQLAAKAYWQRLAQAGVPTPEFVVLFVPGEAFLSQAADHDPALLEHAATRKVILATPTTLITLLRTVGYAWTQHALAANARQVYDLGRELYTRLATLGDHMDRLGRALNGAVTTYNRAVGSLESRVLVTARRLSELRIVDGELNEPEQVETVARSLSSPELVTSADQARQVRTLPVVAPDQETRLDDENDAADEVSGAEPARRVNGSPWSA